MNDSDVIVIGAATTGLGLAKLLDMEGVSVTVVDPTRIVAPFPRGSHIDAETMRTIQTLGLGSAEQGYMVMDGVEGVSQSGEVLFRVEMEQGTTAQGWKADYQFFQPDFEAALRGQLALSERAACFSGGAWRTSETSRMASRWASPIGRRARRGCFVPVTPSDAMGLDRRPAATSPMSWRISTAREWRSSWTSACSGTFRRISPPGRRG